MELSEVGGCRGSGISRFIPRIPVHRFGGNGSSPDVGRPLDGSGDGLRAPNLQEERMFPNILEILLPISCPPKTKFTISGESGYRGKPQGSRIQAVLIAVDSTGGTAASFRG